MNYPDDEEPSPFARVPDKVGSKHYHLYVAMTEEGPVYYTMGIDDEGDEFEIEFDDGCAKVLTHNRQYLMLSAANLMNIKALNDWAAEEYQKWAETPLEKNFEKMAAGDLSEEKEATVRAEYDLVVGSRVRTH